MNWSTFEKELKKECIKQRKSSYYTASLLNNANILHSKGLPIIFSTKHLSLLIGIDHNYLCSMAYSTKLFYRHFSIKKKNGKVRPIDEPLPDLKYVQTWILQNILEKCNVSRFAKAYVQNKSLLDNAKFHRAQNIVVTMDIKDFFPSITLKEVSLIFREMGYFPKLSMFLAHLCCLNYKLPQGAPTSPYLSNLRMISLDETISNYVLSENIRYTRYADDLTFSGSFDPKELIPKISGFVWNEGFAINPDKTRVARKNCRQEVTGIVVNHHLQLCKSKRKYIRQQVYYIKKYGLDSHLKHIQDEHRHYINHLIGMINFACFINPKDKEMQSYYDELSALIKKQKN